MSIFGLFSAKTGHPALYNELCKIHEIDRKVRPVLDLLVQHLDLKQPGMIFVDPNCFRKALECEPLKEHERLFRELSFKWFGKRI